MPNQERFWVGFLGFFGFFNWTDWLGIKKKELLEEGL